MPRRASAPPSVVYLNGTFMPKSKAKISIEDRGFVFGDGVYEVWRILQGRLFEHDRHLARLHRGLRELRITPPAEADRDGLLRIADRLIAENGLIEGEGLLYLEITRGAAPREHRFPPPGTPPTLFMKADRFHPMDHKAATGVAAIRVPDVRWHRCDLKTLQLLPNVFAMQAAADHGVDEAIFARDGMITEGAHSSVMALLDGDLRTHPLNERILPGITREVVLELARGAGICVDETPIPDAMVPRLDELFVISTGSDVMPVIRLDDTTIGRGVPGPVTQQLGELLRARMQRTASPTAA